MAWVCQSLPIDCFTCGCSCAILLSSFVWGRPSSRVMHLPSRPWMPVGVRTLSKSAILLLCVRFGEATNPGPGADSPAHTFSIGACNPSGLPNKAMVIQEHLKDVDLWLVSETHLSEMAMRRFRQSLKCAGSDFKYIVLVAIRLPTATILDLLANGMGLLLCVSSRHGRCHIHGPNLCISPAVRRLRQV